MIRGTGTALNYRITAGERVWISESDVDGTTVRIVDVETVQSIPLALRDHLLVRTSSAPDVYHVDGMALRKVPDWKWVTDHRLRPADTHTVAEWLIPLLPQGAPEWRMPASAWQDRMFFSRTLGRTMPYRVSLPRGYAAGSAVRYPVIYLLHGLSGRYDEWNGYGIDEVASGLVHDGKLGGVILVAPRAVSGTGWIRKVPGRHRGLHTWPGTWCSTSTTRTERSQLRQDAPSAASRWVATVRFRLPSTSRTCSRLPGHTAHRSGRVNRPRFLRLRRGV